MLYFDVAFVISLVSVVSVHQFNTESCTKNFMINACFSTKLDVQSVGKNVSLLGERRDSRIIEM